MKTLKYLNPNNIGQEFDDPFGCYDVHQFRVKDYESIPDKLNRFLDIFRNHPDIKDVSIDTHPYTYNKKTFVVDHTEIDKIIEINMTGKDDIKYSMKVEIPSLINGYFLINRIEKFALYQVVDLPLIRRITRKENETRIFNNFVFMRLTEEKNSLFFQLEMEKYPIIPFLVMLLDEKGKVDIKKERLEFLGEYACLNELLYQEITDIYSLIPPGSKITDKRTWGKLMAPKKRPSRIKKVLNLYNSACAADFFNMDLINGDLMIEAIKHHKNVTESESPTNLAGKRVRISEYLLLLLLKDLFNEYLNLPFRKPKSRKMYIANDFSKKEIVSLVQASADTHNPIASYSELVRGTYIGVGAFNKDYNLSELRDISPSYYWIIDPVMTPDRDVAGLVFLFTEVAKFNLRGEFLNFKHERV